MVPLSVVPYYRRGSFKLAHTHSSAISSLPVPALTGSSERSSPRSSVSCSSLARSSALCQSHRVRSVALSLLHLSSASSSVSPQPAVPLRRYWRSHSAVIGRACSCPIRHALRSASSGTGASVRVHTCPFTWPSSTRVHLQRCYRL